MADTLTMNPVDWLKQAVDADYPKAEFTAPFSITVNGIEHSVATNGHVLLAIPQNHGFPRLSSEKAAAVVAGTLREMPGESVGVKLADLREFAAANHAEELPDDDGDDEEDEDCDFCDGDGEVEVEGANGRYATVECPECDGTGDSLSLRRRRPKPKKAYINIGGVPFDNRLLEPPLQTASDVEYVLVFVDPNDSRQPMLIEAGDWRLVLMPLSQSTMTETMPKFPLATADV